MLKGSILLIGYPTSDTTPTGFWAHIVLSYFLTTLNPRGMSSPPTPTPPHLNFFINTLIPHLHRHLQKLHIQNSFSSHFLQNQKNKHSLNNKQTNKQKNPFLCFYSFWKNKKINGYEETKQASSNGDAEANLEEVFELGQEKWLRRRRRAARGRAEGALCSVRGREQEQIHRSHLVPHPPRVPMPPKTSRGGVRVRSRDGPHYPLRGSRFPIPNLHA